MNNTHTKRRPDFVVKILAGLSKKSYEESSPDVQACMALAMHIIDLEAAIKQFEAEKREEDFK